MRYRALSLWEPWATAIALGLKTIETRSWHTPYRGPILIHAAKNKGSRDYWDYQTGRYPEYLRVFQAAGYPNFASLPFGCVVAKAVLSDCQEATGTNIDPVNRSWGHYAPDRFAWYLTDVQRITPTPMTGRQGLWPVEFNLNTK